MLAPVKIADPTPSDLLMELLYLQLNTSGPRGLEAWRRQIGTALEAWDLSLATRIIAELVRHASGPVERAYALMGRGGLLSKQGRWPEAIATLEKAEQLLADTQEAVGRCWVLMTLGGLYEDQGLWEQAVHTYHQAEKIYQMQGDVYGEAQALVNLGAAYYTQSQWGQALDAYRRSLDIFLDVGDSHSAAMSLSGLGHILTDLGNYEEAIECYEASLQIFEEGHHIAGQVSTLNNLGRVLDSMAQSEHALTYFQRSIELARLQGDLRSQAIALDNLGVALQALGRDHDSLTAHTQTLQIYNDLGDRHSASASLNHLGVTCRKLQRYEAAEQYFERAIAAKRELHDGRGLANVLVNLAILRVNQDRWHDVLLLADEIVQLAKAVHSDEPLATGHVLLGLAKGEQGDIAGAADHYAQAVIAAWDYHAILGRRINRSIVRHLENLRHRGRLDALETIGLHILQNTQAQIGVAHPDAMQAFQELLDTHALHSK